MHRRLSIRASTDLASSIVRHARGPNGVRWMRCAQARNTATLTMVVQTVKFKTACVCTKQMHCQSSREARELWTCAVVYKLLATTQTHCGHAARLKIYVIREAGLSSNRLSITQVSASLGLKAPAPAAPKASSSAARAGAPKAAGQEIDLMGGLDDEPAAPVRSGFGA